MADEVSELRAALRDALDVHRLPYGGAVVSTARRGQGSSGMLLQAKWAFSTAQPSPRKARQYQVLFLDDAWVPLAEAVEQVCACYSELAVGAQHAPRVDDRYRRGGYDSPTLSGWRERVIQFERQLKDERHDVHPVVARGEVPYDFEHEAVQDWLWPGMDQPPQSRDGGVFVIVPDERGRIADVVWGGSSAVVHVDSATGHEGLLLQLKLTRAAGAPVVLERSAKRRTTFRLPRGVTGVQAFLLHDDGTALGRLGAGQRGRTLGAHAPPDAQVRADLDAGEGLEIEFKVFMYPGADKEHELTETMIAFANTEGGRLYLGVDDNCVPQGDAALSRAGKDTVERSKIVLRKRLDTLLLGQCAQVPEYRSRWLAAGDAPVLLVNVEPSAEPLETRSNEVWVRRAGSNKRVGVEDLRRLTSRSVRFMRPRQ